VGVCASQVEVLLLPLRRRVDELGIVIADTLSLSFVRKLSCDSVHELKGFQAVVISDSQ
jgi:hypothetical protein